MGVDRESEVEVIKKETRKKSRRKGAGGQEVGSKCLHQKSQSENRVKKVAEDGNLGKRRESEMTQCDYQQTNALAENTGEKQVSGFEKDKILGWQDHDPDMNDQLKATLSQNLESDIDAKLKELKLKSQSRKGGFKKEQDSQTSTAFVVEVEGMTSEDYYYDPLGHYAVHEETLKDESRMQNWQQVSR